MQPKSLTSMTFPLALLPDPDVAGSMDRGCSLTKFIYKKPIENSPDKVSMQMVFFLNKDFDSALKWLSEKLKTEACPGSKFRVSGVGGEKYRDSVAEATGMQIEFIDEFVAHSAGAQLLVKNFEDDEFCFPDLTPKPQPSDMPEMPDWIQKLIEKAAAHYQENMGKRLPAIFGFCGSAIAFNLLHEDNSLEILEPLMVGGKSLLGLSQLLLGTNNYDELCDLASRGDRGRVDTQAAEMMALGEGSEFRSLPPDTPLFPMGKAAEGKSEFSREDTAASIIGSVLSPILPLVTSYCKTKRVSTIYFGGHLFRSETVRLIFNSQLMMNIGGLGIFKFRFLSHGHTGCLGAMIVSPEEAKKRRINIKYE